MSEDIPECDLVALQWLYRYLKSYIKRTVQNTIHHTTNVILNCDDFSV